MLVVAVGRGLWRGFGASTFQHGLHHLDLAFLGGGDGAGELLDRRAVGFA